MTTISAVRVKAVVGLKVASIVQDSSGSSVGCSPQVPPVMG